MAKKGYWLVCYESVSNPSALAEYAKAARPALEAVGGRLLIASRPVKTYESGVDQMAVLVEFDSVEKAIAAYESDGYKKALKVFNNAAKRDIRLVEAI
jgi:uncharacterized protein (DUF1330 family)